jgi:hypothetical protein
MFFTQILAIRFSVRAEGSFAFQLGSATKNRHDKALACQAEPSLARRQAGSLWQRSFPGPIILVFRVERLSSYVSTLVDRVATYATC